MIISLEGKREGYLLARLTRRRLVVPSRAPPRRLAVRRPDPSGPWCVRVLDSTGFNGVSQSVVFLVLSLFPVG